MRYLMLISLMVALVGCGGGGSGDSSEPTNPPPVSGGQEQGMRALKITSDFDFTTDLTVSLQVVENLVNQRAFLNVCKAESEVIDSENCFLRTPVTAEGLSTEFMVPHKEQKIIAQIWYYEPDMEPMSYDWEYDESLEAQAFTLK